MKKEQAVPTRDGRLQILKERFCRRRRALYRRAVHAAQSACAGFRSENGLPDNFQVPDFYPDSALARRSAKAEMLILSFNISGTHDGFDEAAGLRPEILRRLDRALGNTGLGKMSGAISSLGRLEIFIKALKPDKAVEVIKSALSDHWVLPLMQIRRQARHHPID